MEKQEITTNFYDFLRRKHFGWSEKKLNSSEKKQQSNEIVEELMDLSRKNVECLSEEQTDFVRRFVGVYGKKQDIYAIYEDINAEKMIKEINEVARTLTISACRLVSRMRRGFASVQEALISGKLTYEKLLKFPLVDMDYPIDQEYYVGILNSNGYTTVKKFIESPKRVYSDYPVLVDYMHSLGLSFKEEMFYEKENSSNDKYESIKDLNTEVNVVDKIAHILRSKLDELNNYETRCNEIIEEQKLVKFQIQLMRIINKRANDSESLKNRPIDVDYYEARCNEIIEEQMKLKQQIQEIRTEILEGLKEAEQSSIKVDNKVK